jgi:hypothetical protein
MGQISNRFFSNGGIMLQQMNNSIIPTGGLVGGSYNATFGFGTEDLYSWAYKSYEVEIAVN